MLDSLSRDEFAGHLNTNFTVYFTPDTPIDAELIEVTELQKRNRSESFALLFLTPSDTPIEQALYKVEHAVLGSAEIGLVPVGKDENGVRYEAVFNRIVD